MLAKWTHTHSWSFVYAGGSNPTWQCSSHISRICRINGKCSRSAAGALSSSALSAALLLFSTSAGRHSVAHLAHQSADIELPGRNSHQRGAFECPLSATCCWWTLLVLLSLHSLMLILHSMISITCSERGRGSSLGRKVLQQWASLVALLSHCHNCIMKVHQSETTLIRLVESNPFHSIALYNNTSRPTGGS